MSVFTSGFTKQGGFNSNPYIPSQTQGYDPMGSSMIHSNSKCDNCHTLPIVGKRYRCMECRDFDYCEICYNNNRHLHKHNFLCKVIAKPNSGVNCDGCDTKNFTGPRFKCTVCRDLDLCQSCYNNNAGVHGHGFKQI